MPTIELTAKRDGTTIIEVDGVKGASCTKLTEALERLLSNQSGDRLMKPEAYENPEQNRLDLNQG